MDCRSRGIQILRTFWRSRSLVDETPCFVHFLRTRYVIDIVNMYFIVTSHAKKA